MDKTKWPSAEEVCAFIDQWTKDFRVEVPGLVIVDDSPDIITEPRWHTSEVFPSRGKIFQQREEYLEFIRVLESRNLHGTAIEVGLDQGGSHLGWLQMFERMATIEIDVNKCVKFLTINNIDANRSRIFCADSSDLSTRKVLQKYYDSVDMVFIDGDHQFSSVLCDYKCLSPLVKKGGVIGFHDTLGRHPSHLGVVKFIKKLKNGEIDGKKHVVRDIFKDGTGISYEIVE